MMCAFQPNFRSGPLSENAWGGQTITPTSDRGTTFPANCTLTSLQVVARTTRAGTSPPGGDTITVTSPKAGSSVSFLASIDASVSGWNRVVDDTVDNAGDEIYIGEDYGGSTPEEMQGTRALLGNSTNAHVTTTVHGYFTGY